MSSTVPDNETRVPFDGDAKAADDHYVIRLSGVKKAFGEREILRGVDLDVRRGETLVIMGGSGCGKSTVLRHMIGVLSPDEGGVEVFGQDLGDVTDDDLGAIRRRFGILFQSGALYNSMTVSENVALPLREHTDLDEEIIRIIVKMKLEMVGLREAESLMPAQLSGGMRKRVGLARAIALDPEIIFYDEPTTGLDPIVCGVIDKLINDFKHGLGVSSVVVTHDMNSAFRIADRMVMLYEGRVVASGSPEEMRTNGDDLIKQFINGEPDGPIPLKLSKLDYEADLMSVHDY
jgi:phospholipid/cholesterol/gamma-HCH transport system ATP-binding protein